MKLFSKSRQKTEVNLVFDVGSASVGAAVVVLREGMKPKIAYQCRFPIVLQEKLDFSRFTTSMLTSLRTTSENVVKNGLSHLTFTGEGSKQVQNIFCVFASPWYISQTTVINIKKEKPFVVTPSVIAKLVKDEEKRFRESTQVRDSEKIKSSGKIIEKSIVDIRLNGYPVSNPQGRKTRDLHVALFVGMVSRELLMRVDKVFEQVFHTRTPTYHSFPLVAFSVLRDMFSETKDFLLIDITGEVTDVSIVRGGILMKTASFPKGKNFLIRGVAGVLKTTSDETQSLIRMHAEGIDDSNTTLKMEEAIFKVQSEWLDSFGKILAMLSESLSIPNTVFFTADADVGNVFLNFIEREEFGQTTLTEAPFDVTFLNNALFQPSTLLGTRVDIADPFLALPALFLNKLFHLRRE